MYDVDFYCSQTHRPKSNLTGRFGSMSVCAPRTTLTLTVMKWTFTYLRLKKPKLRLWSWWGYVLLQHLWSVQRTPSSTVQWKALGTVLFIGNWLQFDTNCFLFSQTKANLVTPRNGEPLIAAIQDFLTGQCRDVWQPITVPCLYMMWNSWCFESQAENCLPLIKGKLEFPVEYDV